jgi:hypothetical protein
LTLLKERMGSDEIGDGRRGCCTSLLHPVSVEIARGCIHGRKNGRMHYVRKAAAFWRDVRVAIVATR